MAMTMDGKNRIMIYPALVHSTRSTSSLPLDVGEDE
jgi:hypothetical protein